MPPNLLIMCKLFVVLGWSHGFFGRTAVPFLPWLEVLDVLRPWSDQTQIVLSSLRFVASVLLLFNVCVRCASLTLGSVLVFGLLASRPAFHNHLLLPAVLLILAAIHRPGDRPRLIPLQFSLIYLGAALDKLTTADWRNGKLMRAFMTEPIPNPVYGVLEQMLSEPVAPLLIAWATIGIEAALVVLFLVPRFRQLAVWTTITFHGTLFLMLFGSRFGFFLENILVGLLPFLAWPEVGLEIAVLPRLRGAFVGLLRGVHWGALPARIGPSPPDAGSWLVVRAGDREFRNESALRHILHYSAGFYFLLFAVDHLTVRWLPWKLKFAFDAVAALSLAAFFLPLPWRRTPPPGTGQ